MSSKTTEEFNLSLSRAKHFHSHLSCLGILGAPCWVIKKANFLPNKKSNTNNFNKLIIFVREVNGKCTAGTFLQCSSSSYFGNNLPNNALLSIMHQYHYYSLNNVMRGARREIYDWRYQRPRQRQESQEAVLPATDFESPTGPYWGKYTPFFTGRFILGPDRNNFLCAIGALACLCGIFGNQQITIIKCVGESIAIIGIALLFLTISAFLATSLSDPGVIPKQQGLVQNWWTTPRYRDEVYVGHRMRFCRKCDTIRPPRTYHCDRCDICIRHQDLHFFLGGLCIGERNFLPYFALNFFQVLLAAYLIAVNFTIFLKTSNKEGPSGTEAIFKPKDLVLAAISFFFGLIFLMAPQSGLLMLIYRLYLLSKDRTLREEYRAIKLYDIQEYLRKRNCFTNFFSKFICGDKGQSCFRVNCRRVSNLIEEGDPAIGLASLDLRSRVIMNQNLVSLPHRPSSIRLLIETETERPKRDLTTYLKAKRNLSNSVPFLSGGELPTLPGDRIRLYKKEKPSSTLQKKIKRFHEFEEMPKPVVDFHFHHQVPESLSEGSIPRTTMTPDALNEMLQLARATQIRRIIEYVLARDRRGLVRMARRVDMGGVLGLQHARDPDNLQIIELGRHIVPAPSSVQAPVPLPIEFPQQIPNRVRVRNHPAGLPQMVAAGILPREQGRMARHLTPHNLNALRGHRIHQVNNYLTNPTSIPSPQSVAPLPLPPPSEFIQPIPPESIQPIPPVVATLNNENMYHQSMARVRARSRRQISVSAQTQTSILIPTLTQNQSPALITRTSDPETEIPLVSGSRLAPGNTRDNNTNNNNLVVIFVNSEERINTGRASNFADDDNNNNN